MRIVFALTASLIAAAMLASPTPAQAEPSSPAPQHERTKVLFFGDSVMKAYGLDISQSWPVLLGGSDNWAVTNLASNGSGYVTRGEGDNTFLDVVQNAAAETPDVVVLEGSSNDFGVDNDQLSAATTGTFAAVRQEFPTAQIIGLSTIWGAEAMPDQLADTDLQVQSAVEAVGGRYIDIGQPFQGDYSLMQADDVHPTAAGQVALADRIGPLILLSIADERAARLRALADSLKKAEIAAHYSAFTARLVKLAKLYPS